MDAWQSFGIVFAEKRGAFRSIQEKEGDELLEVNCMEIRFRQLNPYACRTYLAGTPGSGEVVLVDPVLEHVGEYSARLRKLEPHTAQEIVTICRSGGRAHTAAQVLMQAGFKRIYVLAGGMTRWKELGLPVQRGLRLQAT